MAVDFKDFERRMNKALDHLNEEFGAVRAGRANPKVLDRISVAYYGTNAIYVHIAFHSVQRNFNPTSTIVDFQLRKG